MRSVKKIIGCIRDRDDYISQPPSGPESDLPTISESELEALRQTSYGIDLNNKTYAYESLKLVEDDYRPVDVAVPDVQLLQNLDVYSIDGSNQRFSNPAFHYLIARAAMVRFSYTKLDSKLPTYWYSLQDMEGMLLVDGNIFSDKLSLHAKGLSGNKGIRIPLINEIDGEDGLSPLLWRYDPEKSDKNPAAQALGISVRMMQTLELYMLKKIPTDRRSVVIRDGPLFSTSIGPSETVHGLEVIYKWIGKAVLLSVSKRVSESSFLLELLQNNTELCEKWFPGQHVSSSVLKNMTSDALLLPRILKPGQRTPLVSAVGRARKNIVEEDAGLTPYTTIYLSKHKPHTFVRIEVPKIMWQRDERGVREAIETVAWQHELGHSAPLIQMEADARCQLQEEIALTKRQFSAGLTKRNITFPEEYE